MEVSSRAEGVVIEEGEGTGGVIKELAGADHWAREGAGEGRELHFGVRHGEEMRGSGGQEWWAVTRMVGLQVWGARLAASVRRRVRRQ